MCYNVFIGIGGNTYNITPKKPRKIRNEEKMILKELKITNFRNYNNLTISFNPDINIIYGDNGEGKTNLLESIYVLAMTKSHKLLIDNHLINSSSKFARVEGKILDEIMTSNMEVIIEPKKKQLKIDGDYISKINKYITKMSVIIFYPEDLELIKGSPMERRRYLNIQLSQIHPNYLNILNDYNKILKQRNEFLKNYDRNKQSDSNFFDIVTNTLIEKGTKLYQYRENYIKNINQNISDIYYSIMNIKKFNILYKPSINIDDYEKNRISKIFEEELNRNHDSEIKLGITLVGPHRDDFDFMIDNQNLKIYGSQGQQRVAVLSLKLSEIPIFKSYKNSYPILLLDDVFSELDDNKKNNLLKYIVNNIQTFITTTDLKSINQDILKKANIIKIKNGKIMQKGDI
ncbi:MAG: DNA replication/repair protein RecF [Bacilli bacterium]|nr:DNA replication/repair protein RecF [Bacilli bacterium]MDD4282702.1 DNA replication/repair protein RecF [Bacilli bacterium]